MGEGFSTHFSSIYIYHISINLAKRSVLVPGAVPLEAAVALELKGGALTSLSVVDPRSLAQVHPAARALE